MVYTVTLTNPLASGHDGSWTQDLLMECVVGLLPAEPTPPLMATGDSPAQAMAYGLGGSGPEGEGGAKSADAISSHPQHHPVDDDSAVYDIDEVSEDDLKSELSGDESDVTKRQQQQHQRMDANKEPSHDLDVGEGGMTDGGCGGCGGSGGPVPIETMEISDDDEDDEDDEHDWEKKAENVDDHPVGKREGAPGETTRQLMETEPLPSESSSTEVAAATTGGVAPGVGTQAAGGAVVDHKAISAAMTKEQEEKPDSPSQPMGSGEAAGGEGSTQEQAALAPADDSPNNSKAREQQQQVSSSLSSGAEDGSSADEGVTMAKAPRRNLSELSVPATPPTPLSDRPLDEAAPQGERLPSSPTPLPSPLASSARSSLGNVVSPTISMSPQTAESVRSDSDPAFDGSDEDSWSSEGESEDDDSDDYETDVLPPNCFAYHKDRKTFKNALCKECFDEYTEALRKVNLDISDIDSDNGHREKRAAAQRQRRREERRKAGGSGSASSGKRPRKSRGSNSESSGGSSKGNCKKRRRVVAAGRSVRAAPAPGRVLVKSHQKNAKLVAGRGGTRTNAVILVEGGTSSSSRSSSSSSSESGGSGRDGDGATAPLRNTGKDRWMVEETGTKSKPKVGPGAKARSRASGGGGGGGGGGVDLLSALIENPAPARKETSSSKAALPRLGQQPQEVRPRPEKHRSADACERGGNTAAAVDTDGRGKIARVGPLDTAKSSVSLTDYRTGGLRRKEVPRGLSQSSSSMKPVTPTAASKTAAVDPSSSAWKKRRAEHVQHGPKTPVQEGSSGKNISRGRINSAAAPSSAPSSSTSDKYERVTGFRGVYQKKSNGKFFIWVDGRPLDGKPYESANDCAQQYDLLHISKEQGSKYGPKLNFSDPRAPSHDESSGLTPLVGGQGSRMAKGSLSSAYNKAPKASKSAKSPFFAPQAKPAQSKPVQAQPRMRPAGSVRGQQPLAGATAGAGQPVNALAAPPPQQWQHGAKAVMAMIDSPVGGSFGEASGRQAGSLSAFDDFDQSHESKVAWSEPIKIDEDLNGRRKLPPRSALPSRSGLAGGRAGRPVPDTRAECAQTGATGMLLDRAENQESGTKEDAGGAESESTQASGERAVAPSLGSQLELSWKADGPRRKRNESDDAVASSQTPASAVVVASATRIAGANPPAPPGQLTSPRLNMESATENGDEEQGRNLVMRMMAGHSPEQATQRTTNSTVDATASEYDAELRGDEEQGRELMMRLCTSDDSLVLHPEADDTVPPSPPADVEFDGDGISSGGGGEDEDDTNSSSADEAPPVATIVWRPPKKTSIVVGSGRGGRSAPANVSGPSRTTSTPVSHKPKLTLRSFTSVGGTGPPAAAVPESLPTVPAPFPCEQQPPTRQSLPASIMRRASLNPSPSLSEPIQQVAWRNPRQIAAPATVTPTNTLDRRRLEQSGGQDNEHLPLPVSKPDLPSDVVDAMDAPAMPSISAEVPLISWRKPGRSDRGVACPSVARPSPQQVQRRDFLPSSTSLPASSPSSCAKVSSAHFVEQAQLVQKRSNTLPPSGAYPPRAPDERDVVPQGQLDTLMHSANRLAASRAAAAAGAAVLPRQQQQPKANVRPELNGPENGDWPVSGNRDRQFTQGRSRSLSVGRSTRGRESSSSRSVGRVGGGDTNNSFRQGRPDQPPREETRRQPYEEHGRRVEDRGFRDSSFVRDSSRMGEGGRMVKYDRRERNDDFGRDVRHGGGRGGGGGSGGLKNHMGPFGRDAENGSGKGGNFGGYRATKRPGETSYRGGFDNRRSGHNDYRSSGRHRGRSSSPEREWRRG